MRQPHSSSGLPKVSDWQQIARNIAGGGSWNVGIGSQHQLLQYGTCAFGAEGAHGFSEASFFIGNQDIIDLINESIHRYQWFDLVGASGVMGCQDGSADERLKVTVTWGIYHT